MTHTAMEVLHALRDYQIHGAFIVDDENLAVGFVDVYDVVSYLVYCLAGDADDVTEDQLAQFESGDMGEASHIYGRNFAGALIDISDRDQFTTVNKSAKLSETVKLLTTHHRLAVMDDSGKIVNVISQSDIVNFLAQCGHWVWSAAETKVGQLLSQYDPNTLIQVSSDTSVVRALLEMYKKKVVAVAVTNPSGVIVTNLSASDLVRVPQQKFSMLSLPVTDFLKRTHQVVKPPVTVSSESNLELVFLKLAVYKIHRVWVIDANGRPQGVLTLTDIMNHLNKSELVS
jgi:CBS domain-containing protein